MSGIIDGVKTPTVCTGDQSTSEHAEISTRIADLNSEVNDCNTQECNEDSTDSERIHLILDRVNQILIGVILILDRFHIPYQNE